MRRLAPLIAVLSLSGVAMADGPQWAKFASGAGSILYIGAGAFLPMARDGASGREHTLRALDSLVVSEAFTEGLKNLTHVKRPDSNAHDSFPSGHPTAAFSVATMESAFHPSEAPLWYAGAAAIGDSRVELHRHRWSDVIAGAAIGFGVSRWELSRPRGILIQPWMNGNGSVGVIASRQF